MSEGWRIALTAAITIGGGVIVFSLGRLFVALYVEPIHRLRSLIGEIADSLVFYANVYCNPGVGGAQQMTEASEVLRRHASQLRSRAHALPAYSLWASTRLVVKRQNIEKASRNLIGLSNGVNGGTARDNNGKAEDVKILLGIEKPQRRTQAKTPGGRTFNKRMVSPGTLFLSFGTLLLVLPNQALHLFSSDITIPSNLYKAIGVGALSMSILFMVAIFYSALAAKLESILEDEPTGKWQGLFQYLYFVVLWTTYIAGWLKAFPVIPIDNPDVANTVFWIGVAWFFVIPTAFIFGIPGRRIALRSFGWPMWVGLGAGLALGWLLGHIIEGLYIGLWVGVLIALVRRARATS